MSYLNIFLIKQISKLLEIINMQKRQFTKIYTTSESIDNLIDYFQLEHLRDMKDTGGRWAVFAADVHKLALFTEAYQTHFTSENDKFALMDLIIETCNEYINTIKYNESLNLLDFEACWRKIKRYLVADQYLHATTLKYWYRADAESWEEIFDITPFIRGLCLETELEEWINEPD